MAKLSDVILRDTRANQPVASTVAEGTLYGVTDEGDIIERSSGSAWEAYSPTLSNPMTTEGDIITGAASGVPQRLAAGSEADVLTVVSGVPAWQAPTGGGGGEVFLEVQTASASASLVFVSTISSTYNAYKFVFDGLVLATDNQDLWWRMSTNAGVSYDSTSLYVNTGIVYHDGVVTFWGQALTAPIGRGCLRNSSEIHNTAGYSITGVLFLYNVNSASLYKRTEHKASYSGGGTAKLTGVNGEMVYQNATAVDAIQFLASSGNITSGSIRSYGLVNS